MNISINTGLILCLIMPFLHGCSENPASINDDGIIVFVLDNRIEVKNHLSRPIYYFAVERGTAAVIDWAPVSTDENELKPKQQKEILFEDILGYEEGDQLIFYYWTGKGSGTKTIENFMIDTELYHSD